MKFANPGGNVVPQIIGAGNFKRLLDRYYEDVPEYRWQSNYRAIVDGIDDFYEKRVI